MKFTLRATLTSHVCGLSQTKIFSNHTQIQRRWIAIPESLLPSLEHYKDSATLKALVGNLFFPVIESNFLWFEGYKICLY